METNIKVDFDQGEVLKVSPSIIDDIKINTQLTR